MCSKRQDIYQTEWVTRGAKTTSHQGYSRIGEYQWLFLGKQNTELWWWRYQVYKLAGRLQRAGGKLKIKRVMLDISNFSNTLNTCMNLNPILNHFFNYLNNYCCYYTYDQFDMKVKTNNRISVIKWTHQRMFIKCLFKKTVQCYYSGLGEGCGFWAEWIETDMESITTIDDTLESKTIEMWMENM